MPKAAELENRTITLLLVEDDDEDVLLAREALKAAGLRARLSVARDGAEALRQLKGPADSRPDVLLLDLRLGKSNGVEVLRFLRGRQFELPVIIVSGMPDASGVIETAMLALGAVQFLHKPFSAGDLAETVREALSGKPSQRREDSLQKGCIRLDPVFRRVWVGGRLIGHLPPKRFEFLIELARSGGPVRKDDLLRKLWPDLDDPQILLKTIQRLREDLGRDADRIRLAGDTLELRG